MITLYVNDPLTIFLPCKAQVNVASQDAAESGSSSDLLNVHTTGQLIVRILGYELGLGS